MNFEQKEQRPKTPLPHRSTGAEQPTNTPLALPNQIRSSADIA
jgi:hypothetical protein